MTHYAFDRTQEKHETMGDEIRITRLHPKHDAIILPDLYTFRTE